MAISLMSSSILSSISIPRELGREDNFTDTIPDREYPVVVQEPEIEIIFINYFLKFHFSEVRNTFEEDQHFFHFIHGAKAQHLAILLTIICAVLSVTSQHSSLE
jgi:hypothetical protein